MAYADENMQQIRSACRCLPPYFVNKQWRLEYSFVKFSKMLAPDVTTSSMSRQTFAGLSLDNFLCQKCAVAPSGDNR